MAPDRRKRSRCAGYMHESSSEAPVAQSPKARAPRRVLSPEEKEAAKAKKAANVRKREKKARWEETLVTCIEEEGFRWPEGTVVGAELFFLPETH